MTADAPTLDTEAARGAARAGKLRLGPKIAYSTGALVEGTMSAALNVFLLFYVTSVCGVPGALAGAALAVGLAVDAIADPVLGSVSDGWKSRLGRRLPMMIVGLPLVLVSFVLIFSLPASLTGWPLFVLLTTLSVMLRTSLSVFNLPYLAVGAELTDDYAERSSITTWRWGFGVLGGVIAIAVGFAVFFKGDGGTMQRAAYSPYALTIAVFVTGAALIALYAVYITRDRQHLPAEGGRTVLLRLTSELGEVFRNRSFRVLFISALLVFIAQGLNSALGLHANTFFWKLSGDQIQLATLAFFAGLLIGAPVAGPIVGLMEKRTAMFVGSGGLIFTQGMPAALRLLGWLPLEGQSLALFLAGCMLLGGMLMTMAAIALISMLADAADEHEHLFGARREGLYFAGWAFAGKAASGAGALIAGVVLQVIGFPSGAAKTITALPPETTNWLGFFYGPGAAILSTIGLAVVLLYRLDRKTHTAIMSDLTERRAARATAIL